MNFRGHDEEQHSFLDVRFLSFIINARSKQREQICKLIKFGLRLFLELCLLVDRYVVLLQVEVYSCDHVNDCDFGNCFPHSKRIDDAEDRAD